MSRPSSLEASVAPIGVVRDRLEDGVAGLAYLLNEALGVAGGLGADADGVSTVAAVAAFARGFSTVAVLAAFALGFDTALTTVDHAPAELAERSPVVPGSPSDDAA